MTPENWTVWSKNHVILGNVTGPNFIRKYACFILGNVTGQVYEIWLVHIILGNLTHQL